MSVVMDLIAKVLSENYTDPPENFNMAWEIEQALKQAGFLQQELHIPVNYDEVKMLERWAKDQ